MDDKEKRMKKKNNWTSSLLIYVRRYGSVVALRAMILSDVNRRWNKIIPERR